MPIFEYACQDCGSQFEKLVRRTADVDAVRCPGCGQDHLTTRYSTFAAQAGKSKSEPAASGGCGSGMCGTNFCGSGACGMDVN